MVKLNIKPLADRVIVEPFGSRRKTMGGIIIPDTAKEKPQKGVIVAAGNGKKDEPMTVKPMTRFYMVNMQVLKLLLRVRIILLCVSQI